MDLTPFLPLVGTVIGAALVTMPQWFLMRESRSRKRADVQEQTVKDLQDVLAALGDLAILAGVAGSKIEGTESESPKSSYDRLVRRLEKMQAYTAAHRRAKILTSRLEDAHARQLSTETIQIIDVHYQKCKDDEHIIVPAEMGEKFTKTIDRLGEVLTSLH